MIFRISGLPALVLRMALWSSAVAQPVDLDRHVAVTVDDLPATALVFDQDPPAFCDSTVYRDLTNCLLAQFEAIPVTGFVNEGKRICDALRPTLLPDLLEAWLDSGHDLGNHTYSHRAFEDIGRAEVFAFNETFSRDLLGRGPPQILLIHANHLNADYFGQIKKLLQERGYRFVSLDLAMSDESYSRKDPYLGERGLSWLQRLAIGIEGQTRHEPQAPKWVRETAGLSY